MATQAIYTGFMLSKRDVETSPADTSISESVWTMNYKSFLVRIWREDDDAPWRASLMHIPTQETQTFVSVQALLLHLYGQATAVSNNQNNKGIDTHE